MSQLSLAAQTRPFARAGQGELVWVVSSDALQVRQLAGLLEDAGYCVSPLQSAAAALAHAAQSALPPPDVVLLDAALIDGSGFDLARRLKVLARTSPAPLLFFADPGHPEHLLQALESGAADCMSRPVLAQELLARMAMHLAGARERRQARNALDAFGYATLTVRPQDGKLMWQTPLSRELLQRYCPHHPPYASRTAPEVQAWLQECLRCLRRGETPRPLVLSQSEGARLTLQLHQQTGDNDNAPAALGEEWASDDWLIVMREVSDQAVMQALRDVFALTLREAEVLYWVAKGKTNKDVGDILGSSPMTVKKHLERVFVKLGVETRTAAAGMVMSRIRQLHPQFEG
jgi:DNA-binding NarL/FixJ family response regulator